MQIHDSSDNSLLAFVIKQMSLTRSFFFLFLFFLGIVFKVIPLWATFRCIWIFCSIFLNIFLSSFLRLLRKSWRKMEEKIDRIAEKNCKYFFCTRSDKTKLFFGLINSVFFCLLLLLLECFCFWKKTKKLSLFCFFVCLHFMVDNHFLSIIFCYREIVVEQKSSLFFWLRIIHNRIIVIIIIIIVVVSR